MSIAVVVGVHDGVVIASDSASILVVSVAPQAVTGVANVYDNANKIFNLYKGMPIGCVAYGAGSIGNSSIGTLIKDLRAKLMSDAAGDLTSRHLTFDPTQYTMESISQIVSVFLEVLSSTKSHLFTTIKMGLRSSNACPATRISPSVIPSSADTTRMAFGFSVTDLPIASQLRVYELFSIAFMGLPWPMKPPSMGS